MKLVFKNKKVAIIAGVSAAVLVTALGVGLGVGLSSDSSRTPSVLDPVLFNDPIKNEVRNGKDLLINGLTFNNKRYSVVEENGKLFAVIKKNSRLELTQPKYNYGSRFNNYATEDAVDIGGENYPPTFREVPADAEVIGYAPKIAFDYFDIISFGEDYFYTIIFAGIGHVKILNDGYIWGGFHYNADTSQIEKHEALTNGPLKFGTIDAGGSALIDLAVVNEYQTALAEYKDNTASAAAKATAAERIKKADSEEGKNNRDQAELTWKIMNLSNSAEVGWRYVSENVLKMPLNPDTVNSEDVVSKYPTLFTEEIAYLNAGASVDENGKFDITNLHCGGGDIQGFSTSLTTDDKKQVCIEPTDVDENGLATINQEVNVPLGNLNFSLFNFQGGHIKNPLLGDISATTDGYVTLPDVTDRVRVQEKTNYVVVPSDIKIELDKAPSS